MNKAKPLTEYNEGKQRHLDLLRAFVPIELQNQFCQCRDYYPFVVENGTWHCTNCDKLCFIMRTDTNETIPDNANTYTMQYKKLFPETNIKTDRTVKVWVREVRFCFLCEDNFVTPYIPYDDEFCPACSSVQ